MRYDGVEIDQEDFWYPESKEVRDWLLQDIGTGTLYQLMWNLHNGQFGWMLTETCQVLAWFFKDSFVSLDLNA